MKWFSTLQNSSSLERALRQAAKDCQIQLNAEKPDFGLLFVSAGYRSELVDLWPTIQKELPLKHVLGCTAGGVIGGGHEEEEQPAVSLTAGVLPDVGIAPFQLQREHLPTPDASPRAWRDLVKSQADDRPSFLILSDPFSMDADALVTGLDYAFPDSVKVGGLASGGQDQNENLLFSDEKILSRGAVGVAFTGNIRVEAVVAQGCRPIGKPLSITASDGNILMAVDNRPPLAYLQDLFETLSERDQELVQTSLFLGVSMDPLNEAPKQGDFLIRNIIGLDQAKGLLAIGAFLRPGQTVQFHLRDAETSREDLQAMLRRSSAAALRNAPASSPAGAALFSCLGRGKRLYGKADHDTQLIQSFVGDIPVGGFFCNGEIGPVAGRTYLHGYTSSIAVFSPRDTRLTPASSTQAGKEVPKS